MNLHAQHLQAVTRRHFLQQCQVGLGGIALSTLLGAEPATAQTNGETGPQNSGLHDSGLKGHGPLMPKSPHFRPRAKRVIYLHMAGSPSQLDLFDYKPELVMRNGQPCPDAFFKNERFAFIKGHPKLLGTPYAFGQHGQSGLWISELLPQLGSIADQLTVVRSMSTDQFNHAPAQLLLHTGFPRLGYPSIGAWASYGLGTENQDLPGFVVLISGGSTPSAGKSLWGSGFLPGVYQGVQCRSVGDPILFVSNPPGMTREVRRQSLDALADLNQIQAEAFADPETLTRIEQFELAYRMQATVPGVMDITRESPETLAMYGAQPGQPHFANNCLLARRLVEQGVRFVQLFDYGWDHHGTSQGDDIVHALPRKCTDVDQPIAALVRDLKQRGLLEETLVVWGGEFGRTSMNEKRGGSKFLGRDHHARAFTMFFAGGGMKPGVVHGATDELGYFPVEAPMGIRDLQATLLHLLGFDARRLSFPLQGLNARLIGPTDEGQVCRDILA
jgi:hypothetical protein